MHDKVFSVSDLRRWAADGLITESQLEAVLAREGLNGTASKSEAENQGLTLANVLAFFGAFLALIGFVFFVTLTWDQWSSESRIAFSFIPSIALLAVGYYLKATTTLKLGGSLLFMLGTALIPIWIGAIAEAATERRFRSFAEDANELLFVLAIAMGLTAVAIILSRIHYVAFVLAALFVLLSLSVAASLGYSSDRELWWAALIANGSLLLVAVAMYVRHASSYGLWTGNAAHIGFYVSTVYLL